MTPGGCVGMVFAPIFAMFLPLFIWGAVVIFVVAGGDLSSGNNIMNMIAFLLIILAVPAVWIWNVIEVRKLKPQKAELHKAEMEKWENLYYCHECNKISQPGRREMFIDEHRVIPMSMVGSFELVRPLVIENKTADQIEVVQAAEIPSEMRPSRQEVSPQGDITYFFQDDTDECWYCGDTQVSVNSQSEIHLYGNQRKIEKPGGQKSVLWDMAKVIVPRCPECKKRHNRFRYFRIGLIVLMVVLAPLLCVGSAVLVPSVFVNYIITFLVLGALWIFGRKYINKQEEKQPKKSLQEAKESYPIITSLVDKGWMFKKQQKPAKA
jgi:hypothetical protein